jgi:hypothetical protein
MWCWGWSLLRGEAAAQEIQFAIEYAPNPIFHSGTPESAPAEVLESFQRKYKPIGAEGGGNNPLCSSRFALAFAMRAENAIRNIMSRSMRRRISSFNRRSVMRNGSYRDFAKFRSTTAKSLDPETPQCFDPLG